MLYWRVHCTIFIWFKDMGVSHFFVGLLLWKKIMFHKLKRTSTTRRAAVSDVKRVKWLDNQWRWSSLEMQVLESEVCFHNTGSFDPGPQHILLGGHIRTVGYPVQVIQVALGREKSTWCRKIGNYCRLRCKSFFYQVQYVSVHPTYYAAESLSWYSRERLKQACTPPSFHSRWMTPASSPVMKPSSAEPANTNSCRASS